MRQSNNRIFTIRSINLAVLIGSPLTAGFLIYKNFKSFGNLKAAKITLISCFLFLIIAFAIFFAIPDRLDSIYLKIALPVLYTLIVSFIANRLQSRLIDEHLQNNFKKASWLLVPVYSLIIMAVVILTFYAAMFIVPFKGYERTKFINYNVFMHYNNVVGPKDSEHLVKTIRNSAYFNGVKSVIFIDKVGDNYHLKMICSDTVAMNTTDFKDGVIFFKNYMNIYFSNKNQIEVVFVDQKLNGSRVLENRSIICRNFFSSYERLLVSSMGKHKIYYEQTIPYADIQVLEGVMKKLNNYFSKESEIVLILVENENDYTLKFIVPQWHWDNDEMKSRLFEIGNYINGTNIGKYTNISVVDILTCKEMPINQNTSPSVRNRANAFYSTIDKMQYDHGSNLN